MTRLSDVLRDVWLEMRARPSRTLLQLVAVALSAGALLTSLAVSMTAARQVDANLAANSQRSIMVEAADGVDQSTEPALPRDAPARALGVPGVEAAGLRLDVTTATNVEVKPAHGRESVSAQLLGVTAGYLATMELSTTSQWMLDGDEPIILVGQKAATSLNLPVTNDPTGLEVLINGNRFQVVGFLPEPLDSVLVIPFDTAVDIVGSAQRGTLAVRTEIGAGSPVSGVIRIAVRPDAPETLSASQVADTDLFRRGVASDMTAFVAGVGLLLLVLSTFLITNVMVVSVTARTSEIGLRRALGTPRASIAAIFIVEGALTGAAGGLGGSAIAALATVAISFANEWTPILTPWVIMLGPVLGGAIGVLSSIYPAVRASRVSPATAVRHE